MFIAHLPAGFLLSRQLLRKQRDSSHYIKFLLVGLIASVVPDFDLVYFHLIDNRQHPHHSYWTHIPIYWIGIYAILFYPVSKWFGRIGLKLLTLFLLCGLLHMILDSIASGIKWLYPVDTSYFGLWRIPSIYHWWVANYLFHWTFLLELLITASAAFLFFRDHALRSDLKYQCLNWLYQIRPGSRLLARLAETDEGPTKE